MSCFTFPHKSMVRQPFCLLPPHMDKFIVRTKVTKPPRPLPLLASGALQLRKNFDSLVPIPKVHPKFLPQKTSSPKYSEAIAAFCHFKRKVGEHENLRSWQMEFQLMWNEGKADLPALLQQFEKSAREKLDTQASDLLLEVSGRQRFVAQEVESLAISSLSDTEKDMLRREHESLLQIMSVLAARDNMDIWWRLNAVVHSAESDVASSSSTCDVEEHHFASVASSSARTDVWSSSTLDDAAPMLTPPQAIVRDLCTTCCDIFDMASEHRSVFDMEILKSALERVARSNAVLQRIDQQWEDVSPSKYHPKPKSQYNKHSHPTPLGSSLGGSWYGLPITCKQCARLVFIKSY